MTEQTVTPIIIHNTANDLARVDLGALSPYLRIQLAALVSISEILSNGFKINQLISLNVVFCFAVVPQMEGGVIISTGGSGEGRTRVSW